MNSKTLRKKKSFLNASLICLKLFIIFEGLSVLLEKKCSQNSLMSTKPTFISRENGCLRNFSAFGRN